jgi:hypothetical protein
MNTCIANSVTKQEKTDLVRWFVVVLAQHPAMSDITSVPISDDKKDEIDRAMGRVQNRILGVACAKELKNLVRMEGTAALKNNYAYFAELAMLEVTSDPKVTAAMANIVKYVDFTKLVTIIKSK